MFIHELYAQLFQGFPARLQQLNIQLGEERGTGKHTEDIPVNAALQKAPYH